MTELWLITGLVFGAVLFGVEAVYWLVFHRRRINKTVDRRLELSRGVLDPAESSNALRGEPGLLDSDHPVFRNLNDLLAQTGLRPDKNVLLLAMLALGVLLFFAWAQVVGYGPTAIAAAVFSAFLLLFLFFRSMRQRRIARFAELLPESIDVIVRAVRVGYPLPLALDLVAREMPAPVGPEFRAASDEIAFGQDVRTAIEHLYRRGSFSSSPSTFSTRPAAISRKFFRGSRDSSGKEHGCA